MRPAQINWPRMESLTGRDALLTLQDELGSLAYRNPEGGAWETADRYLSGNVRAKLAVAQAAEQLRLRPIAGTWKRCAKLQPKDLEPGEIEARLGSSWIPPSDIRDFVAELLDVPARKREDRIRRDHRDLDVELTTRKVRRQQHDDHGTARFRASDLIEQSLNGRTPTAYDEDADGNRTVNQPETIAASEKQQQLKDRFRDWVWENRERAERLAQDYNFRFNNIRLRDFDGSHLTCPEWCAPPSAMEISRHIRRTPSGAFSRAAARCWLTSSARAKRGP
jgi:N12 class adenine-specific DNA methylase